MSVEERFEELFRVHGEVVLAYLARRTDPPHDAADLMAEVFTTAWRRIHEVPPGDDARLWLFTVARNVLANHRRGAVRRHRLAERLRAHLSARPSPASAGPDAAREALDRLAAADRELLTLTAWEGLTPAEISTLLGLPAATVRTRLSRARRRLRDALERDGGKFVADNLR